MPMSVSTLDLTGPYGPGGRTWHTCYVLRTDPAGVTVCENADGSGERRFYPMCRVEKITEKR